MRNEKGQFVKGCGTHKMSYSREYRVWWDMLNRCTKPSTKRYADYGGRGITLDPRWHKFENFYADMGNRPSSEYSIERIDNNKGYSPQNCRWATRHEQYRNRRTNKYVLVNGEKMIAADFQRKYGLNNTYLYYQSRLRNISYQTIADEIIEKGRDDFRC